MKMKENETLNEFSSIFMELVNQMKSYGEKISDKRIVEKLLISLPDKFDPIVAVIEETKDLSLLNVQELFGSLKTYEQRLLRHSKKSIEKVIHLEVANRTRKSERKRWKGRGRFNYGRKFTNEEGSSFSKCNICKRKQSTSKLSEEKEADENMFYACQSILLSKRIMCGSLTMATQTT
ncbi:hypothetical protein AAG906_015050 [Vitis piasezkii]